MGRSLSEAAQYVLERFAHYQAVIPNGSRFAQMYQAVCDANGRSRGYIPEGDSHFETAREALRDVTQLEFFFDQIADDPEKDKYVPIITRILSDSVLPQDDPRQSQGRDAQAEAFVFAVCKNAQMYPSFEEPDVTCGVAGGRVGIAVKRIKALPKLEKRLKDASKQIERSGLLGIISVEVTLAVNPENSSIVSTQNESQVRQWWADKFRKIVDDCDARIWAAIGDEGVLGVLLHEHCPLRLNEHYTLRSMTYGRATAPKDRIHLWDQLIGTFLQGLPNFTL